MTEQSLNLEEDIEELGRGIQYKETVISKQFYHMASEQSIKMDSEMNNDSMQITMSP